MAVGGNVNVVEEVDAVPVPIGPDNPWGNAFRAQKTRLTCESEAKRVADNLKARVWHISNPTKQNRLGQDVEADRHDGPAAGPSVADALR